MIDNNNFEDLKLDRTINTIGPFPYYFRTHWHKHVEIIALPSSAVITKKPIITINQTEYSLNPGDVIFVWPGELHEITSNPDKQILGIQFAATVFNELPDFARFLHFFRSIHQLDYRNSPDLNEKIIFHMQHIFEIQTKGDTFCGVESIICLYELFMSFGRYIEKNHFTNIENESSGSISTSEKIMETCNYISDNCEQELSLESVSDFAGFSQYYFSRVFKQTTGYNFVEYLILQRVKRAQTLLADSDMSITEISYQAGFKSISTFNRVFKQYRGCSPSKYRNYYVKKENLH